MKAPILKYVVLLFLALGLASCVTSRRVNLLQEPTKHNKIPSYDTTHTYEDYLLRIGDRLYIYVYSVDENVAKLFNSMGTSGGTSAAQMRQQMTQGGNGTSSYELYSYLVLEDGTIDFPLVGKIPVRGLTTRQVKLELERELASYIKDYGDYNMVSCEVNVVQRTYSLITNTAGSGNFPIRKEKLTIYEALAQAGGLGDWTDRSKVRIIREIEGQTKVIMFDVRSKDIINSEFYYIEPNDVIYVQHLRGKSFGISNAATTVGIVASFLSVGTFVYALTMRIIKATDKSKTNGN